MSKNILRVALAGLMASVVVAVGSAPALAATKSGFKSCQANYHVTVRSDAMGMIDHEVNSSLIASYWRPTYAIDFSHSWYNSGTWEVWTNGGIKSAGTYAGCAFGI